MVRRCPVKGPSGLQAATVRAKRFGEERKPTDGARLSNASQLPRLGSICTLADIRKADSRLTCSRVARWSDVRDPQDRTPAAERGNRKQSLEGEGALHFSLGNGAWEWPPISLTLVTSRVNTIISAAYIYTYTHTYALFRNRVASE